MSKSFSPNNITKKYQKGGTLKLRKITPLDNLPGDLKEQLKSWYEHEDTDYKLFATLVNGIYSEHSTTFLFSMTQFVSLFENDSNHKQPVFEIDDDDRIGQFMSLKRFLIDNKILEIIEEGEKPSDRFPNGKATKCKFLDKELLEMLNYYWNNKVTVLEDNKSIQASQ